MVAESVLGSGDEWFAVQNDIYCVLEVSSCDG